MEDRKNFVSLWDIITHPMKIIRQLFMIIFAAVIGLMTASCDLADVEQGLINSTISSTVTENGKDEDKESGEEDGKEDENPDDGTSEVPEVKTLPRAGISQTNGKQKNGGHKNGKGKKDF